MGDVKRRLREVVDGRRDALVALSHGIHGVPELGFEERQASARVADALDGAGFDVRTGACDMETAFVATAGSGPLTIGICAEYDALPGIGHACGHNIIAACAAGAGIGLAQVADDLGITVRVLGTPAEENGGGKVLLLDRGGFDGVHAAMMVHPSPKERVHAAALAIASLRVQYHGRSAHASAYPELGVNAADALTVAQVAIGLLRQHFNPRDQVHGIVTGGGDAPNVVPAETEARYYLRAPDKEALDTLRGRVARCFEAGAIATGARLDVEDDCPPYTDFRPDLEIGELYRANAEAIGRTFPEPEEKRGGSTDMANVSLRMPAIHPSIAIEAKGAVNHQPEFTAACVTPSADRAVRDGALTMAMTVADVAVSQGVRERLLARDTTYRAD
jgi:amidohydrolase